jgi:hypothetical protein
MMGCESSKCYLPRGRLDVVLDGADKGIIPLTCSELFDRVESKKAADPNINFTVEVSYIEVSTDGFTALHRMY